MPLAITERILVKKIKYDYKYGSKDDELSWPLWQENTDGALGMASLLTECNQSVCVTY